MGEHNFLVRPICKDYIANTVTANMNTVTANMKIVRMEYISTATQKYKFVIGGI